MEQNNQNQQLSAEEMAEFRAFQEAKRKQEQAARRKQNREAYAAIVDETVAKAIGRLKQLSEQIAQTKRTVMDDFRDVLDMKQDVMQLTKADGQHSHTFTNSDATCRIVLGSNTVDDYRDTVEDGIAMVKQYIESLAKDDNSRALVNAVLRLLSRDQKGTLKASRVIQLKKMAEETGDEQFIEGVRIIEESYQPAETKQYIRAEWREPDGAWQAIPLSVTDA